MNTRNEKKNIVITGGSNGLGKAMALHLAKKGYNILFTYCLDEKAAQDTIKEIEKFDVNVKAVQIDLCKNEDIHKLKEEGYKFFDEIHVLINNAGILSTSSILDASREEIEKVFRVNTLSPVLLIQEFCAEMKERQCKRVKNTYVDYCIINVTSISRKVSTGLPIYEMSKAALHLFTKSGAFEFAKYGIRFNDLAPGLSATEMNRSIWQNAPLLWKKLRNNIPLGFAGEPTRHIAQAIDPIIENDWMTGSTITIDGGRSVNFSGADIYSKDVEESSLTFPSSQNG